MNATPGSALRGVAGVAALLWLTSSTAPADDSPYGPVILEEITSRLERPLFVTAPPGDHDRLFIVEQDGDILILDRTTGN